MGRVCQPEIRKQLWGAMLDNMLRSDYFGIQAQKYSKQERYIRSIIAFFSILTTLEVAAKYFTDAALDFLIVSTAIITTLFAIWGISSKVRVFADLARDYTSIVYDFELIWRKMLLNEKIPYKERLFELLEKSNSIKRDPTISLDKKLVKKLEIEIDNRMITRGWA